MENFNLEYEFTSNSTIRVKKFRAKSNPMTVYFADMDSQVINGYFCFGNDKPEAMGIETLLWHLDSSGGLLPRAMRGDMLRPAWQFHGAENPLADRDQSSYVCCALGENAFMGTFSCCVYLLQNIEAVFDVHGLQSPSAMKFHYNQAGCEFPDDLLADENNNTDGSANEESGTDISVSKKGREIYCLSEAGEGAMAWEATLQSIFPSVKAFANRLAIETKNRLNLKMRDSYDRLYRPENLTVVITGSLKSQENILEILHEYNEEYFQTHPHAPEYIRPWSTPFPEKIPGVDASVCFVPRNPNRTSTATVCFGWRGVCSYDLETSMALKVLTAHIAVGPLWDAFVTKGLSHRISWCQLEYAETCDLITVHGVTSEENLEFVIEETKKIIGSLSEGALNDGEVRAMADRVGWHYVRELESDPYLIIASAFSKGERYGNGDEVQIKARIQPRSIYDGLLKKPIAFWRDLVKKFFVDNDLFITRVVPKAYGLELPKEPEVTEGAPIIPSHEVAGEMNFAAGSRRASSKPRRKTNNPTGEEGGLAATLAEEEASSLAASASPKEQKQLKEGHIEERLKSKPFPFKDSLEEVADFEKRLSMTSQFLEQVSQTEVRSFQFTSYRSDSQEQHPIFPVNEMPFFTFLEDIKTSFVYMTMVFDTTFMSEERRKLIAPITAALGAILCPRPPGLDTDAEIVNPNEFNPPRHIADSQVSLGMNGELMQSLFITLIIQPEYYEWAVGMLKFLLYEYEFTTSFLRFIYAEAARGLASNYRMQTAENPNYDSFEASEINLHALIKLIYKENSNARLFVGRRRLDLITEYGSNIEKSPDEYTKLTNDTWREVVDSQRVSIQIASDVSELATRFPDLKAPWNEKFPTVQKSLVYSDIKPTTERMLMRTSGTDGMAVSVNHFRPPCLSIAIPINVGSDDFPKLCITSQLISMAQKWVWNCLDEEDVPQPALRMPCSFANIVTLNLESYDLIGAFEAMKLIIKADWPWLNSLLIATKLMVVNDPASMETGAQGTVASALLAHLGDMDMDTRRDLLLKSLNVTLEEVQETIGKHLIKIFDPSKTWYTLMTFGEEKDKYVAKLSELYGFKFTDSNLHEICTTL